MLGISVRTLQNWEQKRRVPEGPARVLLAVAEAYPEDVRSVSQLLAKRNCTKQLNKPEKATAE
jgi:putative transcriptional regulator